MNPTIIIKKHVQGYVDAEVEVLGVKWYKDSSIFYPPTVKCCGCLVAIGDKPWALMRVLEDGGEKYKRICSQCGRHLKWEKKFKSEWPMGERRKGGRRGCT